MFRVNHKVIYKGIFFEKRSSILGSNKGYFCLWEIMSQSLQKRSGTYEIAYAIKPYYQDPFYLFWGKVHEIS